MTRKEALQLIEALLSPTTLMEEKRTAAARLSELIRILLPETDRNK